jgi:hypothetical protein
VSVRIIKPSVIERSWQKSFNVLLHILKIEKQN